MTEEFIVKSGETRTVGEGEVAHAMHGSDVRGLPGGTVHVHTGANVVTQGCTIFVHPGAHFEIDANETAYVLPGASAEGRPGSTIHLYPGAKLKTKEATVWLHAGTKGFNLEENETGHILPGAHALGGYHSKIFVYPGAKFDEQMGTEVVFMDALPADLSVLNVEEILANGYLLDAANGAFVFKKFFLGK